MTADQWVEVERLFHEAMQLALGERAAFAANIADTDVRAEVASLVAAEDETDTSPIEAVISEAAQAVLDQPLSGRVLGHFRVIREIGRGAMGEVYLAQDLKLGRQVALKLLPAVFLEDSERVSRFEREARAAAALNHPNVMTVHEVGEWEGRPFIAAEFVEGETLAQKLNRGPLSVAEAARVGVEIASALAAAHQAGIIHRDLKPANIMLRADGAVKVLDFGLARLSQPVATPAAADESEMRTIRGRILGTPAYMAPEQLEGKPADARSDIYAFGCVFHEMLTGRRAARERRPLPSRSLERILSRCLAPDPADRWQSAADLGRRLEQARRARSYWREAGIAVVAAILAVGGILWWQQRTQARPLTDQDVLVLADFLNTTGDPIFDGALRQALAIHLEQSPFLKIMEDQVVRQDLRLMGRPPGQPITSQAAHEICVREAAAATIEGSIAGLGKTYVITLQAVTCQTGATLARAQAQAEDKEQVLKAVGTAATAMRAKLGESLATIQKGRAPLDQFTTSSLEALQTYAMGYTSLSQGQFLAAIPFFRRATELDPNFAWAYMVLSIAYNNAGDMARCIEYQKKAFALVDRVSEFERLFISARYHWQVTGELNTAIDFYRLLTRSYPRYWGARSELSFLYRNAGEFEKALEEAQEAVRLGPRIESSHRNLASAYMRLDRLGEARELLAKAKGQFDGPRLHQRLLELAFLDGDQAAAGKEIQWYAGKPEEYFSFGGQAANAAALGQRRKARDLYGRAAETALRRGLAGVAAEFEEADALAGALLGDCRTARRVARPPLALALCGDGARAEKLAGETSRISPNGTLWNRVQLPTIRAAMELRRNQPARAVQLLTPAVPYERAYPEAVYLRGLAYLRLRRGREAAAEFQKILDHKGASWGLFYSLSYPGLARAVALSGDTARARNAYRDFFSLWKDADSDLAVLADARKESAALR